MENRLPDLIQRLADEVPDPVSVPPELVRRSRRRILRNGVLAAALATGLAFGSLSGFRALTTESGPERLVPATDPTPGRTTENGAPAPERYMAVIRQMVDAINARDANVFISAFARRGQFNPHGDFSASSSLFGDTLPVADAPLVEAWMAINDTWGLEAELRSCTRMTEADFQQRYGLLFAESDSFVRCAVATRWHRLSLEIVEGWMFEFRGTNVFGWRPGLLDLNPPTRALPLGYDGLEAWEAWLLANDPDDAARYLNPREGPVIAEDEHNPWGQLHGVERDWVINGYRFWPDGLIPYDPAFADEIEASIQDYLAER